MNVKLAACILETRQKKNFADCIVNHLSYLPAYTDLIIHTSRDVNTNDVLDKTASGRNIDINYRNDINSIEDYNKILTSVEFWNDLYDYDRVLIFQCDSVILRKGIEDFYKWSYIGSPWLWQKTGGNGGLSLRDPKAMLDICKNHKYDTSHGNEDVYFCNIMHNKNIWYLAPREACEKFSCEAIFSLGTFGAHAIEKYLSENDCRQIMNQYK